MSLLHGLRLITTLIWSIAIALSVPCIISWFGDKGQNKWAIAITNITIFFWSIAVGLVFALVVVTQSQ